MYKRIVILSLLLTGCFKTHHELKVNTIEVTELAKEVRLPKLIMNEIEAELKKESATVVPVYLFTPLQVQFNELSEGVLKNPALKYAFPKGGGSLDLKDVVTGYGSFYMSFPEEQFEKLPDLVHLYYMSNSPVKKIDGESFGLGCGKLIDLKKSFSKLQKADFFKLNTSEIRYLHVISGRYIFVFKQGSQVYLSQLSISDSRHSKELCLGADFL